MCGSGSGAGFPKSWRTRSSNAHVRDDPRSTAAYHSAMSILESWNGKADACVIHLDERRAATPGLCFSSRSPDSSRGFF
jgi:hypothetical protein